MVDKMEALNNSHTVMWHENMRGAYSKYFPGEVKTDTDQHGGLFKVTMNKHGFRGKSHAIAKGPGDVRIVPWVVRPRLDMGTGTMRPIHRSWRIC